MSGVLLLLAAAVFLALGLRRFAPPAPSWLRRVPLALGRLAPGSAFWLGVSLGLLPCGFLYAGLAAAAASGSVWSGALGMLGFGFGTVPTLVAVALAGGAAAARFRRLTSAIAPVAMTANAVLLISLAVRSFVAA
jgi:sulfite exporter TauE/SafE